MTNYETDTTYRILASIEELTRDARTGKVISQRQVGEQIELGRYFDLAGARDAFRNLRATAPLRP